MVLRFTKAQMQGFEQREAEAWYRGAAKKLQELYPSYMDALGVEDQDIRQFCALIHSHAKACELSKQRDVFKLVVLAFSLGAYFTHDPRFRRALEGSLDRTHIPAGRRVILLSEFTGQWLQTVWKNEPLPDFGNRLIQHLKAYSQKVPLPESRAEHIFDMHPAAFFDRYDLCGAFNKLNEKHCDHYGMQHPVLRFAYMGCAVMHGVQWFDDPLLKNLRLVFSTSKTLDDLCDGFGAFHKGFA